jgi:ParB/RepB/Spo0J family partition protein
VSDAITKTKAIRRIEVPVGNLVPNENNPNEMSDAEFNMLYDNIERVGVTDPILVRPIDDDGTYRVIGGHHRLEVAKLIGFDEVPCTIIDDENFDDDAESFQLIRHNVIRGRMSPKKFVNMYESLSEKYADDIIQESMGFVNEDEFQKLIAQTSASLPTEMKEQFDAAKDELKTIDDLSKLLNSLFGKFGDSLPYGYMFVDYGGQDSIWLRMQKHQKQHMTKLGEICRQRQRSVDHLVGGIIERIVQGELDDSLDEIVEHTPEVVIPDDVEELPTLDFLEA